MSSVTSAVYAAELPARLMYVLLNTPSLTESADDAAVVARALAQLPRSLQESTAQRLLAANDMLLQVAHRNMVLFALLPPTAQEYAVARPAMQRAYAALAKPLNIPDEDCEKFRQARSTACVTLGMNPLANAAVAATAVAAVSNSGVANAVAEGASVALDVGLTVATEPGIWEGLGELLGAILEGLSS